MNKLARFVLSLRRKNIFVSVASTRKVKPALGKFKRRWGPGRTVNLLRTFTQIKLCVMELKVKNNTIIFCLQLLVFYSFFFFKFDPKSDAFSVYWNQFTGYRWRMWNRPCSPGRFDLFWFKLCILRIQLEFNTLLLTKFRWTWDNESVICGLKSSISQGINLHALHFC